MQKIICSPQVRLPQKMLKAMLVSSMVVGLLLPLSAVAADDDLDSLTNPVRAENLDDNINLLTNDTVNSNVNGDLPDNENNENKESSAVTKNIDVKKESSTIENSNTTDLSISEEGKSVTSAFDEVEKRASSDPTPKATTVNNEVADKEPSWMSMEYLLGGGLLLLLLGGGLLLFGKINELKNDNKNLAHNNANLKRQSDKQTKLANSAQKENKKLVSDIELLKRRLDEQHTDPVEIDNELSSVLLVETPELTIIDDLNKSDRTQLASIFENWLRTNRGNTDVRDLIPGGIQGKLKDSDYLIEFWGQSDGLDSVEITKNTMHTTIISLIKHDNQGYAYCYKKPNSMSALWKNKAWYDVEKVNGTLKTMGESLETT